MAHFEVSYVHGTDIEAARAWVREVMGQLGADELIETMRDAPSTGLWVRQVESKEHEQVYVGVFTQVRFRAFYGDTEVTAYVHRLRPRPHENAPEHGLLGRVRGWLGRGAEPDTDALWAMTDDSDEVIIVEFGMGGPSLETLQQLERVILNHGLMLSDYRPQ